MPCKIAIELPHTSSGQNCHKNEVMRSWIGGKKLVTFSCGEDSGREGGGSEGGGGSRGEEAARGVDAARREEPANKRLGRLGLDRIFRRLRWRPSMRTRERLTIHAI